MRNRLCVTGGGGEGFHKRLNSLFASYELRLVILPTSSETQIAIRDLLYMPFVNPHYPSLNNIKLLITEELEFQDLLKILKFETIIFCWIEFL